VCDLTHALQQSQPKISRHLALLRRNKLVVDRRQGQWVFYQVNPQLATWAQQILALTLENNLDSISGELARLTEIKNRQSSCS